MTAGRTAGTRARILGATIAELADRGYGALTVEGVAVRPGCTGDAVPAVGDRNQLVLDAVEAFAAASVPEVP